MNDDPMEDRKACYLVTGATGFLALHLMVLLLARGHRVRATLRRMNREREVREVLARRGEGGERVEFMPAELESDAGWDQAVSGVDGVFHVASPVPTKIPLEEARFTGPARDGTLRVLEAARRAQVKRVVITSSIAAITSGHSSRGRAFSEEDWSIVELAPPYEKSKTLAERAAWDWASTHPEAPELAVVNPSFVLGPVLGGAGRSPSLDIVRILLDHRPPGVPDLWFGLVDVRDVADAHYLAMRRPEARGQRFICNAALLSYQQIAHLLREHLAPRGIRISTRRLPNWLMRCAAPFNPSIRFILPRLGQRKELDSTRLRERLGWEPRSIEETLRDTADSLLAARAQR